MVLVSVYQATNLLAKAALLVGACFGLAGLGAALAIAPLERDRGLILAAVSLLRDVVLVIACLAIAGKPFLIAGALIGGSRVVSIALEATKSFRIIAEPDRTPLEDALREIGGRHGEIYANVLDFGQPRNRSPAVEEVAS